MIPNCKKDILIDADKVYWGGETYLDTYLIGMFNNRRVLTFSTASQIDSSLSNESHYNDIIKAMPSNSIIEFITGDTNSNGFYNASIYSITNYYYCYVIIWKKDSSRGMIQIFLCGSGRSDYYSGNIMRDSNNNTYASIKHIGSEPWVTPTLLNGFEAYQDAWHPVQYRLENNRVHLRGMIKDGTLNKALFTLPARYCPIKTEMLVGYCHSTASDDQLRHLVEVNTAARGGNVVPRKIRWNYPSNIWLVFFRWIKLVNRLRNKILLKEDKIMIPFCKRSLSGGG